MTVPVVSGSTGSPPGRVIGGVLQDDLGSRLKIREIDQDVQSLRGRDELFGQRDGRRQIAAVPANLYEWHAVRQLQVVEARIGAVDDAEAILAALYLQVRPHLAVDQDRVAKVLRDPSTGGCRDCLRLG